MTLVPPAASCIKNLPPDSQAVRGDLLQAVITALMSVIIIEELEMVDIQHDEGEGPLLPHGAAPFPVHAFVEALAVREARSDRLWPKPGAGYHFLSALLRGAPGSRTSATGQR